jgi:MoaA/NifB/PqqE/SkfB family radical SAM enzyme
VRLAGGGEPLFHRQIREVLEVIASEKLPIENITTNGVLITDKVIPLLIDNCDEITLSLNTADPVTYASMMQTTEKNFERVVKNAKHLIAERDKRRSHTPKLVVQYLVWKENFRSIERMYDLAREIGADSIVFNGLSHLRPEQNMTADETNEMMDLYRAVVQRDGYRTIDVINSFEQDLRPRVAAMNAELHQERMDRSLVTRARDFLDRSDFTLAQKLRHHQRVKKMRETERATAGLSTSCLIGWYSMVVRTSGEVGPCCILQGKPIGNVYRQSLDDVWSGEGYAAFRAELHRMMNEGASWEVAPGDRFVEKLCGGTGAFCPISDFYFRNDVAFMGELQEVMRTRPQP